MEEKAHAKLAPSASARWIGCPGATKLCEGIPETTSAYAELGTKAHELAATCLTEWATPASNGDDMAAAVRVYVDFIESLCNKEEIDKGLKTRFVEERFSLEWLHKDMFGTSDCAVYDPKEKRLTVVDYKHGAGVAVDVEWNTQLMIYALGMAYHLWTHQAAPTATLNSIVETVDLVIVQPRAFHSAGEIRKWTITIKELMFWAVQILKPAAKATEEDNAMLRAGKHCRFCPALATCPEQIARTMAVAKAEFNDPVLPARENMTGQDVARVLKAASLIGDWVAGVKAYAHQQLERGMKVDGWKLVRGRSNRKWIDEGKAEVKLFSLLKQDAYIKKVLSIAQAEKELKKYKISPEGVLAGLWEKPPGALSLAPESDKRPPATPSAEIDFTSMEDLLQ